MERKHVDTLRIGNLNLTYAYLKEHKNRRNKICQTILFKAFDSFKVPETIDKKAEVVSALMDRSIKALEFEEIYEEAQIILEIKNQIPVIVEKLKSQLAQENPN